MRAATGSEPVRKAFEVGLVNLVEDRHHGVLDDLVLQCRDAQGALPPITLRYVDSSRRLYPVRSTMDSTVQIVQSIFQSDFIPLPPQAIASRRGFTTQGVKTIRSMTDHCVDEPSA